MVAVAASGALAACAGGVAHADSNADGAAADSPGVLSGNAAQLPVQVPVNLCDNGVSVVGLLNPVFGGVCANAAPVEAPPETPCPPSWTPTPRVKPEAPEVQAAYVPPAAPVVEEPAPVQKWNAPVPQARLAETGAGAQTAGLAVVGVAFLLGGTILYRRASPVPVQA
ncbi:chaplin family protein [Yinghuangia soli]|uniref:DUF320 domain-containing protein n=1 Tax=Yinghuangia soli TaxID=2908204 RepID=A0AA41Q824_9ACTN|nr:chaplin family protein [Yinghuangia soli]MCF2533320.1 DUF320 domain-containing protein [Yinghuangia soli]